MLIDLSVEVPVDKELSGANKLGHLGTHLDLMDLADVPVEKFITRGKLLDLRSIDDNPIEPHHFSGLAKIEEDDFVIFHTGWLKKTYGTREYHSSNPELSRASVDFLISKKVAMLGVDGPAIARGGEQRREIDTYCAHRGVFIVENLTNLELIPRPEFRVYCFPLKLVGASGLPTRVVVEV